MMKVYIVYRNVGGHFTNVVVTSSKKLATHLASKFQYSETYEVEEHDLIGEEMMEGN